MNEAPALLSVVVDFVLVVVAGVLLEAEHALAEADELVFEFRFHKSMS